MGNSFEGLGDSLPEWSVVPLYIKILGAVVVGGITYILYRRLRQDSCQRKEYPKDTVILHQIGRGPWAPSMTPFAIKLESYLRLAKIPYMNEHGFNKSSKGKYPWMEYNGDIVADSQICIEYLNKKLNIDINNHLTNEQRGIGRAFQKMFEENTYWGWALFRWYYDPEMKALSVFKYPKFIVWFTKKWLAREVKKVADAHGIGRHSKEEVYSIMYADLKALSDYLGKKKFLFGDKPCEMDCAIFGQLAQMYWHCFGNPPETAIKEFPILIDYCDRMKDTIWPDWDKCITHGGTQKASG